LTTEITLDKMLLVTLQLVFQVDDWNVFVTMLP